MKTTKIIILAISLMAAATGAGLKVDVHNPNSGKWANQVVALDWKTLQGKLNSLAAENARVLDASGKTLPSQPADNDHDGTVDELLFVTDLAGQETRQFQVVADASLKIPATNGVTFARFVPERSDDFAWENDVVAFRAYGPALRKGPENSGIDCFMKRVKYPMLDKWYEGERKGKTYHLDTGEGYDGYKVSASLGCGGSAVWRNGKVFMSEVFTGWTLIARGPLRSVFELSYGPWDVEGRQITEKRRITIDLGSRLFKVEDSYFVDGKPAKMEIVIGLANHAGKAQAYENRQKGYLYCWEKIDNYQFGTGLVVAPEAIKDYKLADTKDIDTSQAMYVVSTNDDGRITYYAGYGWERANEILTREQWESYLAQFAEKIKNPIAASFK